jgi:uncharacterized protein YxjI
MSDLDRRAAEIAAVKVMLSRMGDEDIVTMTSLQEHLGSLEIEYEIAQKAAKLVAQIRAYDVTKVDGGVFSIGHRMSLEDANALLIAALREERFAVTYSKESQDG